MQRSPSGPKINGTVRGSPDLCPMVVSSRHGAPFHSYPISPSVSRYLATCSSPNIVRSGGTYSLIVYPSPAWAGSLRDVAAVDREQHPRDVDRLVGRQEQRG